MDILSSVWYVISAFSVFTLGLFLSPIVGKAFGVSVKRAVMLYIWHTVFALAYILFTLNNLADSVLFYANSKAYSEGFNVGTKFVLLFTSYFSGPLDFSYLGVTLVYNFIGFVGLAAFCGAVQEAIKYQSSSVRRIGLLLIFLPSVSFWTSGITKDAIAFMAVGLALWAALDLERRRLSIVFAICAMLAVRPHISVVMLFSYTLAVIYSSSLPLAKRAFMSVVALVAAAVLIPFALEYSGLGVPSSTDDVTEYVNGMQEGNLTGGGAVDISSMSPPMQLFTYMFRPLPFEVKSIPQFGAALDNVVLLALLLKVCFRIFRQKIPRVDGNIVFLWTYTIFAWVVLAVNTSNLGISVRQKWMIAPFLIYLLLASLRRRINNEAFSLKKLKAGSH